MKSEPIIFNYKPADSNLSESIKKLPSLHMHVCLRIWYCYPVLIKLFLDLFDEVPSECHEYIFFGAYSCRNIY